MNSRYLIAFFILFLAFGCNNNKKGKPVVLVFSKTNGYHHSSIPNGIAAVLKLGEENNFEVDTTTNSAFFKDDSLKKYAAIIFMNTSGDVLDYRQEAAFERYIQSGGGFVGVHAASGTEYGWKWYGRLLGAYFEGHPAVQEVDLTINNRDFIATEFFADRIWRHKDEIYNFKEVRPDISILISADERSYNGGNMGEQHPISWFQEFDGGRAFYTGLGHTEESYSDEKFLKHLLGGIKYAIGKNKVLNYEKATTQIPPDESRFSKKQFSIGELLEPIEMAILPNLDILVVQRRGEIMLYKQKSQKLSQVGFLDVYDENLYNPDLDLEEGIMGLQKDPDYETNNWVYIYYSPAGKKAINRLSRFKFKNDIFYLSSEQVILEVGSQREFCCHTGGSIAFGPDNLLYLSTGDNTNPFNAKNASYVSSGYAPLNDIPGMEHYDAQRSSGNTNDLRGKILRIKINDDGSYNIPEGNLFPEGTEKTRPEIYTMGHRNPYRISVDPKNGYLYWGDVGPDAVTDSIDTRGPKGYDEINQARKAGNFGWPFFVGNNFPYRSYDYRTGKSGAAFNRESPVNNSLNNTGLVNLPPALPAFIWYPYKTSEQFPGLGNGGRSAMAGPVYYSDLFPTETRLPRYYSGKVIIYDWMRGWMKAVNLFDNGDLNRIEPFAPQIEVNSLIDMEVGPDGRIYLLEYGSGWYSKNADAGLARLDFQKGNLPPEIKGMEVDKTSGQLPLTIKVKVNARDVDGGSLKYIWDFGDGQKKVTKIPYTSYTYTSLGEFKVSVEVIDELNASSESRELHIYAGNELPDVKIHITKGNRSFFMPGVPITYNVTVSDKEDGKHIDPSKIFVSADYNVASKPAVLSGHDQANTVSTGKGLTQSLDCKSCHKENEKSIGPAYFEVSERYKNDENVYTYLTKKIIEGGSGAWGEVAMPAHPNLSEDDVKHITSWILSLTGNKGQSKSLPASGVIFPKPSSPGNSLVITASYKDKGASNSLSLTGSDQIFLSSNIVPAEKFSEIEGFLPWSEGGKKMLLTPTLTGAFTIESMDLTDVKSVNVNLDQTGQVNAAFNFEVYLDNPNGLLLGKKRYDASKPEGKPISLPIPLKMMKDGKFHRLYFTCTSLSPEKTSDFHLKILSVRFEGK